jgi:hypothetical protein
VTSMIVYRQEIVMSVLDQGHPYFVKARPSAVDGLWDVGDLQAVRNTSGRYPPPLTYTLVVYECSTPPFASLSSLESTWCSNLLRTSNL